MSKLVRGACKTKATQTAHFNVIDRDADSEYDIHSLSCDRDLDLLEAMDFPALARALIARVISDGLSDSQPESDDDAQYGTESFGRARDGRRTRMGQPIMRKRRWAELNAIRAEEEVKQGGRRDAGQLKREHGDIPKHGSQSAKEEEHKENLRTEAGGARDKDPRGDENTLHQRSTQQVRSKDATPPAGPKLGSSVHKPYDDKMGSSAALDGRKQPNTQRSSEFRKIGHVISPKSLHSFRLAEERKKMAVEMSVLGLDEEQLMKKEQSMLDDEIERLAELSLGLPSDDEEKVDNSSEKNEFKASDLQFVTGVDRLKTKKRHRRITRLEKAYGKKR